MGLHKLENEMMNEFWIVKNSNILMAKTQKVICVAKLSSSNDNRKPSSSDFQNLISAKCCSNEDHRSISPAAFPNPPTTSGVTVSSFQIHNILPFDSSFYTLCSNDIRNSNSLESVKLSWKCPSWIKALRNGFDYSIVTILIPQRSRSP